MFYTFRQNNSWGRFENPALTVIVEAGSPDEANRIAEANGLYFDGCEKGIDCPCCGDRWYSAEEWNGEETLDIPKEELWNSYGKGRATWAMVIAKDGTISKVGECEEEPRVNTPTIDPRFINDDEPFVLPENAVRMLNAAREELGG